EIRLQGGQVDLEDPLRRLPAEEHLAGDDAERVRLLRQRQPERRSPALEPGDRAAHRLVLPAEDAAVQRLCGAGRVDVFRDGSEKAVLKRIVLVKRLIFIAALIPAAMLVYYAVQGDLTANPIEFITHFTGDWAIRFL